MSSLVAFDSSAVREALDAIAAREPVPRGVAGLSHRRSPYSSSFPLDELAVEFDDGTHLALVLKNLSREAMLATARQTRPRMLDDPRREIEIYRAILAEHAHGTARYHGAVVDPAQQRFWLFLENVPGLQLCDVGDFRTWEQAARWLGRFHALPARNGTLEALARSAHLMRYDEGFLRTWGERAERLLLRGGVAAVEVRKLLSSHDRAVTLLAAQPPTFIHGEFYAANIVVSPNGGGEPRLCVVDWELAALGPALMDLAAVTSGTWSADERGRLVQAYVQGLVAGGVNPGDAGERATVLAACRLHLAIRLLGWSLGWTPPARHAQDWWTEALEAAVELDRRS